MNPRQRSVADGWIELESDPGLFTLLIENFDVRGVEVEEIYDLHSSLDGPVYGFIFLFKWLEGLRRSRRNPKFELAPGFTVTDEKIVNSIFFAQQKVQNSCATHAILSVLMNCEEIDLGPTLTKLKAFTLNMTPENKGTALNNIPDLVYAHNKHARPDACRDFEDESDRGSCSTATTTTAGGSSSAFSASSTRWQETFHFASFLPIDGHLYEMDSLKPHPIDHGKIPDGMEWHQYFMQLLYDRIVTSNDNDSHEIRYNLMAIVPCKLEKLCEKRELVQSNREQLIGAIKSLVLATEPDIFRRVFQMSSFTSRKKLTDTEILQAADYLIVTELTNESRIASEMTGRANNLQHNSSGNENEIAEFAAMQIDINEPSTSASANPPLCESVDLGASLAVDESVVAELSDCAPNAANSALALLCSRYLDDYDICRSSVPLTLASSIVGGRSDVADRRQVPAAAATASASAVEGSDDTRLVLTSSAPNDDDKIDVDAGAGVVVELSAAATSTPSSVRSVRKSARLRFSASPTNGGAGDVEVLPLKELVQHLQFMDDRILSLNRSIDDQTSKHKEYEIADSRRTHDYDEFVTTFFTMLHQAGHLPIAETTKSMKKKKSESPSQQQKIKAIKQTAKKPKIK